MRSLRNNMAERRTREDVQGQSNSGSHCKNSRKDIQDLH